MKCFNMQKSSSVEESKSHLIQFIPSCSIHHTIHTPYHPHTILVQYSTHSLWGRNKRGDHRKHPLVVFITVCPNYNYSHSNYIHCSVCLPLCGINFEITLYTITAYLLSEQTVQLYCYMNMINFWHFTKIYIKYTHTTT